MKYETKYKALEKLKGLTFDQLLNAWETTEHLNTPETSIVRETKMNQLFTAYYVDRTTVYEKTLDYIYSHEPENLREFRPTIWLWKGDISPIFFVDYVGAGVGCTLATFDNLADAKEFREIIGEMTEKEFENWFINKK